MARKQIAKSPALELAIAKGVVSDKRIEMLVNLPAGYVRVLQAKLEMIDKCDVKVTNKVIAKKAGVSEGTVERALADDAFHKALREMVRSRMLSSVDIYISNLERQAMSGHYQSTKLLLEMTEMYRPVQRIESISMNIDKRELGRMMPDEAKREIVKQWKNLGWTLEEFEMIWETPQEDTSRVLSQK